MSTITVFEDALCKVCINDNPATLGHIKIYPTREIDSLDILEDAEIHHLFAVASVCASILFEGLKAQGTNIFCHDKDNSDDICIEVLARFENDNLGLIWQPQQGNMQNISTIASKIVSAMHGPVQEAKAEEIVIEEDETDQRIEHLRRTP